MKNITSSIMHQSFSNHCNWTATSSWCIPGNQTVYVHYMHSSTCLFLSGLLNYSGLTKIKMLLNTMFTGSVALFVLLQWWPPRGFFSLSQFARGTVWNENVEGNFDGKQEPFEPQGNRFEKSGKQRVIPELIYFLTRFMEH